MGIVVAIDGPSGSGKSSTSKSVAMRSTWDYLDTGALYRGLTWIALQNDLADASSVLKALKSSPLRFVVDPLEPRLFSGDTEITDAIRTVEINENVSKFAAMPELRAELLKLQRKIISDSKRGIVVEGRDIASVVFPDAPVKVFLSADTEVRAQRRALEDQQRAGGASVDVRSTVAGLEQRDALDSGRAVSPLTRLADAVHIDATHLTLVEVVALVADLVVSAGSAMREDGPHG